uniref:Secreted protein n=1 Tax=Romanomermis culicivorax TaxID=13658 RepID=A0A915L8P3_ROMCU
MLAMIAQRQPVAAATNAPTEVTNAFGETLHHQRQHQGDRGIAIPDGYGPVVPEDCYSSRSPPVRGLGHQLPPHGSNIVQQQR